MSGRTNDRRLDCIFCKIVAGEINCIKVGESDLALAFLDMSPSSDGHTLVIPKNHSSDLLTTSDKDLHAVISLAKEVALNIEGSKLDCAGFNFLSNQGYLAGQRVNHMHLHVIPKYAIIKPGICMCPEIGL
ncbi:MAG: hypothetical protein ATN32_05720 [Candidatus Epulonipiscium fishelsonii]|nr:MAG: hypothetical protein ATN32_05720 [Epulopiscium sp. AS2M-Bin002]